jgi:hypothetical protein
LLIAGLLVASAAAGAKSASAGWIQIATWEMNEPAGTHGINAMKDSSGKPGDRDGDIGTLVTTGVVVSGTNKAYEFHSGPKDENRLVLVDNRVMNPFRHVFSVFVRFNTTTADGNIIQKGQSNTRGGSWKVELVNGRPVCSFRGAAGRGAISSRQVVADGAWHRVLCVRKRAEVSISVDGGFPRSEPGRTGNIENGAVLSIGGKRSCEAVNVSCQYYDGKIDRVALRWFKR